MDVERITRPMNAPLCVTVDCSDSLALAWATWANALGFEVRNLSLPAAESLLRSWRPFAVLVTPETLHQRSRAVCRLTEAANSYLVVLPADAGREQLSSALQATVTAATARVA